MTRGGKSAFPDLRGSGTGLGIISKSPVMGCFSGALRGRLHTSRPDHTGFNTRGGISTKTLKPNTLKPDNQPRNRQNSLASGFNGAIGNYRDET
ncbi:MAG UNVERIFIED_CONTAM: hypothetical protein LVR29_16000 [Microcystis novacekii LVE1205-3]